MENTQIRMAQDAGEYAQRAAERGETAMRDFSGQALTVSQKWVENSAANWRALGEAQARFVSAWLELATLPWRALTLRGTEQRSTISLR